ncbi:Glycoside hydrolase superfamily [Penicillium robsamsonii]|uniref:Glycoside hydrolase superfamily n=1 Tax=Penicillium robsamsonii TaxID=1792511 RepID=UPI0025496162|nr:Glycoside hydrolase superfamily [Penicillium robsamsonii]KAJ5827379.1 Glycoside hydrolase superfamily [Penicillium robsamsonii]
MLPYFPDQEEKVKPIDQSPTDQPIQNQLRLNSRLRKLVLLSVPSYIYLSWVTSSISPLERIALQTIHSLIMLNYAEEWNTKSANVKSAVQKACPGPLPGLWRLASFCWISLRHFLDCRGILQSLGHDKHI